MVDHSLDVDTASFLCHHRQIHRQSTPGSPWNYGSDLKQLTTYGPHSLGDKAHNGLEGMAMQLHFEILPIPADGSLGLNSRMVLVMKVGKFAVVETRGGRLDRVH